VSGEKYRCHIHLLNHSVEGSTGDRIDTTRWLIEEENLGAEHEGLGTAQLALVASTQILGHGVLEKVQLKGLHDESFDALASLPSYALEASHEVHTLVDGQIFPD